MPLVRDVFHFNVFSSDFEIYPPGRKIKESTKRKVKLSKIPFIPKRTTPNISDCTLTLFPMGFFPMDFNLVKVQSDNIF